MDRLSTLRWHLRWSSAWALIATFGLVGLGAMVIQHRNRQAMTWDHRNATFAEAMEVLANSERMSERSNAIVVLYREMRSGLAMLRSLRTGFEPDEALAILRAIHEETR